MAQCPSCRFENMPQHKTCVRCGSILPGNDASIGFEPPRAGKWEKRLRIAFLIRILNRFFGLWFALGGRTLGGIQHGFGRILESIPLRDSNISLPSVFWRGTIPGLPQWFLGRTRLAKIFFGCWIGGLLLVLLTLGTTFSTILLGLVISCHLMSIIDFAWTVCFRRDDRVALLAIMVIGAIGLFYIPTSSLIWSRLGMMRLGGTGGQLQTGDTFLYRTSWFVIRPKVGDVVLYMMPRFDYTTRTGNYGGNAINRLEGRLFDRVLAVEGQKVEWRDGKLSVDGEPSTVVPFVPSGWTLPDMDFTVPEGQFHVIPGFAFQLIARRGPYQRLREPPDVETWQRICLVSNESVFGVVWGCRRSLFRFVDLDPPPDPSSAEKKE